MLGVGVGEGWVLVVEAQHALQDTLTVETAGLCVEPCDRGRHQPAHSSLPAVIFTQNGSLDLPVMLRVYQLGSQ